VHQSRRGGEGYGESFLAGGKAKRERDMGLSSACRNRVILPATTVVTAEYAIDSILSVAKPLSLQRASGTAVTFS